MQDLAGLCGAVAALARRAGAEILRVYSGAFAVQTKADGSPLTQADRASHDTIVAGLAALTPGVPVVSEESSAAAFEERRGWPHFWLVDPLDGTREFVKRNGEFTVNIALIAGTEPVLGVVHTPVWNLTHYAAAGTGAFRAQGEAVPEPLRVRDYRGGPATVVASRSHGSAAVAEFLARLKAAQGDYTTLELGSALKVCLVAEGAADVYPRLGPTWEWDTAAAQCVLEVAGGRLHDLEGRRLRCNTPTLLNPWFIASGAGDYDWLALARGLAAPPRREA
jgi:3'(2'), 5'-bisphosphate nucleotidase